MANIDRLYILCSYSEYCIEHQLDKNGNESLQVENMNLMRNLLQIPFGDNLILQDMEDTLMN